MREEEDGEGREGEEEGERGTTGRWGGELEEAEVGRPCEAIAKEAADGPGRPTGDGRSIARAEEGRGRRGGGGEH